MREVNNNVKLTATQQHDRIKNWTKKVNLTTVVSPIH